MQCMTTKQDCRHLKSDYDIKKHNQNMKDSLRPQNYFVVVCHLKWRRCLTIVAGRISKMKVKSLGFLCEDVVGLALWVVEKGPLKRNGDMEFGVFKDAMRKPFLLTSYHGL